MSRKEIESIRFHFPIEFISSKVIEKVFGESNDQEEKEEERK